jgi:predicted nuclease of predicted toxin-antitoxin system
VTLLTDVNISPLVVAALRDLGATVVRVGDVLDVRAPDEAIVAEAVRTGAILVSRDQDFSAILATSGATHPSLINVRVSELDPRRLARIIVAALDAVRDDLVRGAIVTIDDGGMRVHPLPVA